jgi:hypothetical protein
MDNMPNPPDVQVVAIDELPRGRAAGSSAAHLTAPRCDSSSRSTRRQRARSAPPPYGESFIIEEGTARFTVGERQLEATGGHIVVVPAGVPHGLVNVGPPPMRSINVHLSPGCRRSGLS